jgi:transketolase
MDIDVVDPTRRGQDLFVLSKGHAVAAMASIYAEFGYFDRSVLHNSRSYESILNGHPGPLLYDRDYTFAFGKASVPFDPPDAAAVIVSSGRGVHEALAAASICVARGVNVRVIDMPSIDDEMLIHLCHSKALICLAEQNNGYILQNVLKVVYRHCPDVATSALQRILAINTLDADGRPRFIHSGTYKELIAAFGAWRLR